MDERTPTGERDVFNLLASGPDDWLVLHSLDLAPWNRGLRTEIDFLVIVPDAGILCMEIKSHENIGFDGFRWFPETINRSPFKQASDGRHAFHRQLVELAPQFRRIPVVHCCIFPRAQFDLLPNLSVQAWELMDSRVFRAFGSGNAFCENLKIRLEQSISADRTLMRLQPRLSYDQISSIVRYCLPIQKFRPDARQEIACRERDIEKLLREQQKPVLQLAQWNNRLVVSGGAGTGKTFIAMEVAMRAAEKGRRVALLCYNQLVGNWMRQRIAQMSPVSPNLVVGRAIRIMMDMTGINVPAEPSRDFWDSELPLKIEERLTDPEFKAEAAFDYLVLDEAQDILARPRLWNCLEHFLIPTLNSCSFALFGDFDNQVLTNREPIRQAMAALDKPNLPVFWKLTENCRNYPIVGDTAVRLSGLDHDVYSGYMRSGGGLHNYDIFFYADDKAQLDKIREWLKGFRAEGYKASEITILSFRPDPLSAAERLKNAGYRLRPVWQPGDLMSHASVYAFKGMENKVIILTDVVLDNADFHRDMFYIGMTRATESVRVLCHKDSQSTLLEWLAERTNL